MMLDSFDLSFRTSMSESTIQNQDLSREIKPQPYNPTVQQSVDERPVTPENERIRVELSSSGKCFMI